MDRSELAALLNLSEELIAAGRPNRPGSKINVSFVTMHNTSNPSPGADARAHSKFVRNTGFYLLENNKKNWVSWHYTVDDTRVIKQLPANEKAYHAGPANSVSIGVEVCMNQGIDRAAADLRAARLAALLLFDFGLTAAALRTHKSWTNKKCPQLLMSHWSGFVKQVEEIRRSITSSSFVEVPEGPSLDEIAKAGEVFDQEDIDHDELAAALTAPADGE